MKLSMFNPTTMLHKTSNQLKTLIGKFVSEIGGDIERMGSRVTDDVAYKQIFSRHRTIFPINGLIPEVNSQSLVSPNSTLIGAVSIKAYSNIGYNVVMKAEISSIRIGSYVTVGDNCVLETLYSTPNGVPSSIYIGDNTVIEPGCTIASSIIEDNVLIGAKSIISEGVVIGKGAVIAPNSFIPPGRLVPAGQHWGGNPIKMIEVLKEEQIYSTYIKSYDNWVNKTENNTSNEKEMKEKVDEYLSENYFSWRAKYYH